MSTIKSIATHEEFIRHCYAFRINLQRMKDHGDTQNYRQSQTDAIVGFKKIIEIANQEANGNGELRHDFECWLLWNYELNQDYINSLVDEKLGFPPACANELMNEIRMKKENNKRKFIEALIEYEHVKKNLERQRVQLNLARHAKNFFVSILGKILAFDTIYMYEMQKVRLEEECKYITERMQQLHFSNLSNDIETHWKEFETTVKKTRRLLTLQNDQINDALNLQMLAEKRSFLQQMAQKIGEIYESIRNQLRQIRNNAFTLQQAFLNPIRSPVDSMRNIIHVFCHPLQTAQVAWEWVRENPGKSAVLIIGTLGISLIIGAVVGFVGSAWHTGTSILSVTAADFVIGGTVAGIAFSTTALTAVGGKAARESALTASSAIDAEMMLRRDALEKFNRQEEAHRKAARESMRAEQKKIKQERRQTSYEVVNRAGTATTTQSVEPNEYDRLVDAAQEMQFANEDVNRALIQSHEEEKDTNDNLSKTIQLSHSLKEAINQEQFNRIKKEAKELIFLLNHQDRFDESRRILDALKEENYEQLKNIIDQFNWQYDLTENELTESAANNRLDDID